MQSAMNQYNQDIKNTSASQFKKKRRMTQK